MKWACVLATFAAEFKLEYMLKKLIVVSSMVACLALNLYAQTPTQTIRGVVVDVDTRMSIPGANIVIVNSSPLIGTTTAMDGSFVLPKVPVGRQTLQVSFMGYHTFTLNELLVGSGKEVFVNVEIKEMVLTASEVVIKASVEKDKAINTMATVSARSFSVEETRRYAGSNDDPLRSASSFAGVSSGATTERNDIVIRGNSPKGLLWRLEGVDIPNPNHFARVGNSGGGLTIFSTHVLGNSDFFTAAFPAEYGDALSGVFDVKFRNGNPTKMEYAFQVGLLGLDAAAEGPLGKSKKASFLFNYRYSTLALLGKLDKEFEKTVPDYQDLSFKINLPTTKMGTFSILGLGGVDNSGLEPESDTLDWVDFEDRQKTNLKTKMGAVILTHSLNINRMHWMKTSLAFSLSSIQYDDGYYVGLNDFKQTDVSDYTNKKVLLNWTLNSKFGKRLTNKFGFQGALNSYDIQINGETAVNGSFGELVNSQGNGSTARVFDQLKLELSDRFTLNGGLAGFYSDVNSSFVLEPRLGLRYNLNPRNAFSLGFGLHSQMESLLVYKAQNNGVQLNKDLGLAKAAHYVLRYDLLLNEHMRLKAEAYYQHLFDLPVNPRSSIALINLGDFYFNDSLKNMGSGKNYGLELTLERFLHNGLYYLLTSSLYRSSYVGGDGQERNTRFDGRFVVNALVGKEFTVKHKNLLGFNLKATYSGGEWYVPVDVEGSKAQNRTVYDYTQAYQNQLPAFFYTDFTVSYRVNHQKYAGIWAIQIKNVLNHRPVVGYRYNGYDQQVEAILPMGMVPVISYKIEF